MAQSFRGGIHLPEHKELAKSPVRKMPAPAFVTVPLLQHIGAPCKALVKVGDEVKLGQKIGDDPTSLCCPVHASVSGRVTKIEPISVPNGAEALGITIENDFRDEISPEVKPFGKAVFSAEREELIEKIREAGISGMGGASFPTFAKVKSAVGKAKRIIINCAECEPYITANHRLLLENTEEVIGGVKILLCATGAKRAIFAVEDNKEDAVERLMEYVASSSEFVVRVLKTKYPQGDERQLVRVLSGREIPKGKLPADLGYVIFNAETCRAVYRAFATGEPLVERIVTVAGDCVGEPANLSVRIGTSFEEIIRFCGGLVQKPDRVISGGPMMGSAQWSLQTPVTKGVGALLCLTAPQEDVKRAVCIHCGRCVRACPMRLFPLYLSQFSVAGEVDEAQKIGLEVCNECGCCSYVCPGKVPILQNIRIGKDALRARMKKS